MITKTHKGDLGLGLPEKKKKKKKKKVVRDPETQYSVLDSGNYFSGFSTSRAASPTKCGARGRGPESPLMKKKKKKKKGPYSPLCDESLVPEFRGRRSKPSSPRRSELAGGGGGEKKKRRKSLWPLTLSPDARTKGLDPRPSEKASSKKLKKARKKSPEPGLSAGHAAWFCEAGDAMDTLGGAAGDEPAAWGQKRKQGSPRSGAKLKRKKKTCCPEVELAPGLARRSRALDSSPRKSGKKKPAKGLDAAECLPIGDGPKVPTKKKPKKCKEKAGLADLEELAAKRKKKKKRRECPAAEETPQEAPDTDLEVVLEKKGNMDELHIDQVRRKALQEEIDRESGKTETSNSSQCQWTETRFGQWDTSEFDTDEKRLKFFKLMGGLKNLSPSYSRSRDVMSRTNMALDQRAADMLQRHLQRDYDRALDYRCRRGVGLGFRSQADRVFYIDKNGSRSLKFED
ncbi:lysine-rich nucleolar protein 1 [Sorex fumeus]|uniref:lysine-rich nucleolar protein 1 n=1 Tax=Sorex fumeus TaxID=62283 RepID=UPI0024ACA7F1|nr:lysine-rich nucleolar protein 1 [Sorex fumeus]